VEYEFDGSFNREDLLYRESSMWRYAEMLPLYDIENRVSLGEGMTPLLALKRLGASHGYANLHLKEEGYNPTGSFKSRGISMALSKARELGVTECVIPTAGNAGGALSAYCAVAGIAVTVVMPENTPQIFKDECRYFGAKLILIDGLIDECGKVAAQIQEDRNAFNVSTLKEPYRLEGKKTMGYELAEQLNWELPDVIIYPTGGGTGLIGIWKAIAEMKQLNWLENDKLPRMIAVQTENCTPVVDAFEGRAVNAANYKASMANGLAVPGAFGIDMILEVLKSSAGLATAVSEEEIMEGVLELCSQEGIMISPEGAATWKALQKLTHSGQISKDESIVLLNTGSGYKYMENYD